MFGGDFFTHTHLNKMGNDSGFDDHIFLTNVLKPPTNIALPEINSEFTPEKR